MRILYFTRDYSPHDYRFLNSLARTGHQVFALRLERRKFQVEDRVLPPEINQISWKGGKSPARFVDFPGLLIDLKKVISQVKPDLIHAGSIQTSAFLAAATGFQPLVSMSWGSDLLKDAERNLFWRGATRYTLSHTKVLVGDCQAVKKKAVQFGFPENQVVLFPWGVDLTHFSPGAEYSLRERLGWEDAFVLLSLRSWEPIYGVDVVLKAFVEAARIHPELRLLLLGSGSQTACLHQILEENQMVERVYFGGQVSHADLPLYYRTADLYLSASHSDGSSVSLLEAFACGRPVVVSDIPGNLEWVTPGQEGWLFPDGDVAALVERINQAMNHRETIATMGKIVRDLAEKRADWSKNFQELLRAYENGDSRELMNLHHAIAIIQARMSSTRLPGKVLQDIGGRTMLERVVVRTRHARSISEVLVATTIDPSDDVIYDYCRQHGFPVFRGSQFDVLDRYYQIANLFQTETVVRLTSDCPLIDPAEIDHVVGKFKENQVDFAANRLPPPWKRTYPIGLDIEVCSFSSLTRAWMEARQPFEREHVMPYLYDEPGRFNILVVDHDTDYGDLRWTVDTAEDLEAVRKVFEYFEGDDGFSWLEVLDLYKRHPDLKKINQSISAKKLQSVDERSECSQNE